MNYGGKPLDGVSQVEALWSKVDGKYEVRDEILQYINPYSIAKEADPRGDWKDGVLKGTVSRIGSEMLHGLAHGARTHGPGNHDPRQMLHSSNSSNNKMEGVETSHRPFIQKRRKPGIPLLL